jgi:cyclohexyl-isocyanide hydratase
MNLAVLLFHAVHELDAVGPYSALEAARRFVPESSEVKLYTVAKSRTSVETSGGLVVTPHWAFASAPEPDVLIVPGGRGVDAALRDRAIGAYLTAQAPRVRVLASVCTGAFLLGHHGLLRDLAATTWAGKRERLRDYEVGDIVEARVVRNRLAGGREVWCGGGVTAGIDVGLELAQALFGREVAERAATQLNYPYWSPEATLTAG